MEKIPFEELAKSNKIICMFPDWPDVITSRFQKKNYVTKKFLYESDSGLVPIPSTLICFGLEVDDILKHMMF
jgi:hypothetical protein